MGKYRISDDYLSGLQAEVFTPKMIMKSMKTKGKMIRPHTQSKMLVHRDCVS